VGSQAAPEGGLFKKMDNKKGDKQQKKNNAESLKKKIAATKDEIKEHKLNIEKMRKMIYHTHQEKHEAGAHSPDHVTHASDETRKEVTDRHNESITWDRYTFKDGKRQYTPPAGGHKSVEDLERENAELREKIKEIEELKTGVADEQEEAANGDDDESTTGDD